MAPTAKQRIMVSNRVNASLENRKYQIRNEYNFHSLLSMKTYPFDSVLLFARVEDLVEVGD